MASAFSPTAKKRGTWFKTAESYMKRGLDAGLRNLRLDKKLASFMLNSFLTKCARRAAPEARWLRNARAHRRRERAPWLPQMCRARAPTLCPCKQTVRRRRRL